MVALLRRAPRLVVRVAFLCFVLICLWGYVSFTRLPKKPRYGAYNKRHDAGIAMREASFDEVHCFLIEQEVNRGAVHQAHDDVVLEWKQRESTDELADDGASYSTVQLLRMSLLQSVDDANEHQSGYKLHNFNQFLSDKIGFYSRPLPNVTPKHCPRSYKGISDSRLSVIVTYHNEAASTLLRTLFSIEERTPSSVLHEIILVDDGSNLEGLLSPIAEFKRRRQLPRSVRFVSNVPDGAAGDLPARQGLVKSRLNGARASSGDILVFLDSHIEVNVNWWQPLVAAVLISGNIFALPVVDLINPHTFEYTASPFVRGGFTWGLRFRWDHLPGAELWSGYDDPRASFNYATPVMPGGAFAVRRSTFFDMGALDDAMSTWGGENLELSFRIWQCGGRILTVPCSRVGHVFRSARPADPIKDAQSDYFAINSMRTARVWMDGAANHVVSVNPGWKDLDVGDLSFRRQLRKEMDCKKFNWFLKAVYPEQTFPDGSGGNGVSLIAPPRHNLASSTALQKGQLQLDPATSTDKQGDSRLCAGVVFPVNSSAPPALLFACDQQNPASTSSLNWKYLSSNTLEFADAFCMDTAPVLLSSSDEKGELAICATQSVRCVSMRKCHKTPPASQDWRHFDGRFVNIASGRCLAALSLPSSKILTAAVCDFSSPAQKFIIFSHHNNVRI